MRVAFTGHRPDKLGGYDAANPTRDRVKEALRKELNLLRREDPALCAITGMALGVDQWAAEVCFELGIPYLAAVPFQGQERVWPDHAKTHYEYLLRRANAVHVVSDGGYAAWKLHKRNQWMVDNCDLLLAVWDGTGGGTASCVAYAVERKRPYKRLAW